LEISHGDNPIAHCQTSFLAQGGDPVPPFAGSRRCDAFRISREDKWRRPAVACAGDRPSPAIKRFHYYLAEPPRRRVGGGSRAPQLLNYSCRYATSTRLAILQLIDRAYGISNRSWTFGPARRTALRRSFRRIEPDATPPPRNARRPREASRRVRHMIETMDVFVFTSPHGNLASQERRSHSTASAGSRGASGTRKSMNSII